jgi:hypothetical protein
VPDVDYHGPTHRQKEAGGTDPLLPLGRFVIKLYADRDALDGNLPDTAIVCSVGDGRFVMTIPPDLNGTSLWVAEASVSAVPSDDIEITIRNLTQSLEMLTSPIVIPSGDFASFPPAATVINASNNLVMEGDRLSFNVDNDGGGDDEGLAVIVGFF